MPFSKQGRYRDSSKSHINITADYIGKLKFNSAKYILIRHTILSKFYHLNAFVINVYI